MCLSGKLLLPGLSRPRAKRESMICLTICSGNALSRVTKSTFDLTKISMDLERSWLHDFPHVFATDRITRMSSAEALSRMLSMRVYIKKGK